MKKLIFLILLLLLFPIGIKANNVYISNYYIDVTIEEKGDVLVKELFVLNGTYNGATKALRTGGGSINPTVDFEHGSKLYDATSVELVQIKEIKIDNKLNYDYINHDGTVFEEVFQANLGDKYKYTKEVLRNGYEYKIYNPSKNSKKAFYVEYIYKNIAIKHNDVGELWLNIFDYDHDNINNLLMYVHVPNNKNLLRAWGHGPLIGDVEIIDNQTVKYTIEHLYNGYAMNIRLAFDNDIIPLSNKTSNIDNALDKIVATETKWANESNEERERAKLKLQKQLQKDTIIKTIYGVSEIVLLTAFIAYLISVYVHYDKEHNPQFKGKYYRDFPSDDEPAVVSYLINKNIGNKELSATILYLIYRKIISYEELPKNDFLFKLNVHKRIDNGSQLELDDNLTYPSLSIEDNALVKFLFGGIDNVKLSTLKSNALHAYSIFLEKYTDWIDKVRKKSEKRNFFEDNSGVKSIGGFIAVLLGAVAYFTIKSGILIGFSKICIAIAIIGLLYILSISKRSKEGNELYCRWRGLNNFLVDFGRFNERDLPAIELWDKYLVYALVFGCADQLAYTMKIKAQTFQKEKHVTDFNYMSFDSITNMTSILNKTMDSTINTAYSASSVASSSFSSGDGSGGGFSSGGGSSSGGGFSGGGGGSTGHF